MECSKRKRDGKQEGSNQKKSKSQESSDDVQHGASEDQSDSYVEHDSSDEEYGWSYEAEADGYFKELDRLFLMTGGGGMSVQELSNYNAMLTQKQDEFLSAATSDPRWWQPLEL